MAAFDCQSGFFLDPDRPTPVAQHCGLAVMQAKVPECVSMALCDEVWTDPASGKKSVIGIFEDTWARRYPGAITKFEAHVYSKGVDVLARFELEIRELLIPEAGAYLLALEIFGTRIAARRLLARVRGESS